MIYVIGTPGSAVVKIGFTAGDPAERLSALQIGNPQPLTVLWSTDGDKALESHLHAVFHPYRVRGEWFDLEPLGDAVEAVRGAAAQAGTSALLKAPRFRRPAVRPVTAARVPRMAAVEFRTDASGWERRFPPVTRPGAPSGSGNGAPKPGCIRLWDGKCERPRNTTCGC